MLRARPYRLVAVGRLENTVADAAHAFDDVDRDIIGRLSTVFAPQA